MNRAFLYILRLYLKNFFSALFALVAIITLIDFVQHMNSIVGANRAILYIYYIASNTLSLIYPIALVFGAVMALSSLLFKNHLVAFTSFGYSKFTIAVPLFVGSLLIYAALVGLNFTKFAYSGDKAEAIISSTSGSNRVENIFFKYNNSFVSAKSMDVVNRVLKSVKIYNIKDGKLESLMELKSAKFSNGGWIAKSITKKSLIYKYGTPQGYKEESIAKMSILKGYYPKVVKLLYEGKRMSIGDGLKALTLLNKQNIDNSKITTALNQRLIMPLFAPILIIIIAFLTPLYKRYVSKAKFYLYSLGSTLITWSLLYSLNMMSINGVVPSYLGQPLIIAIMAILAVVVVVKRKGTI